MPNTASSPPALRRAVATPLDPGRPLAAASPGARTDAPLDRLTRLAAHLLQAPSAGIALVEAERLAVRGGHGPAANAVGPSTVHAVSRCVVESAAPLLVDDVDEHPRLRHGGVGREERVRACAAVPLRTDAGTVVGVLCVLDTRPRCWPEGTLGALEDLAACAASEITLRCEAELRRRASDALRQSEARFRAFVEQATDALVVLGPDARFLYASPAIERLTGRPAAALLGTSALDLLHEEDAAPTADALAAVVRAAGANRRVEVRVRHADGRWVTVDAAGRVLRADGEAPGASVEVLVNLRDTTARRAAEHEREHLMSALIHAVDEARVGNERFQSLSAASPVGIFESDGEGHITYANTRALQIFGMPMDAALGDGWVSRIHPDDRELLLAGWTAALHAGEEFASEYRLLMDDGTERWISGRAAPLRNAAGLAIGTVGTLDDITARRALGEQLRHAQKMEAVGKLAGGIAHDFNNIVMVIQSYAGFVADALAPGHPLLDDLGELRRAADRAASLTRQLLAFGRKQVLKPSALDLDAVVGEMEAMLRRVIDAHIGIAIDPGAGGVTLLADRGQVEQVILNLAVNARDAMPDGGMLHMATAVVELRDREASLRDVPAGEYVRLTVRDTGCGMHAAVRQHVFEPFFTTKPVGRGTGLGLSTVYGIVRQSGGAIWVDSAPGEGAAFHVILPRHQGVRVTPTGAPPAACAAGAAGATVLLAEDEPTVRALARRVLEESGCTVLEAGDGAAAVAAAAAHPGRIDLLVTDMVMPRLDGARLAAALRASRPGLRVIYMSGYADEEILGDGLREAGTTFLQKPFAGAMLADAAHRALAPARAPAAS